MLETPNPKYPEIFSGYDPQPLETSPIIMRLRIAQSIADPTDTTGRSLREAIAATYRMPLDFFISESNQAPLPPASLLVPETIQVFNYEFPEPLDGIVAYSIPDKKEAVRIHLANGNMVTYRQTYDAKVVEVALRLQRAEKTQVIQLAKRILGPVADRGMFPVSIAEKLDTEFLRMLLPAETSSLGLQDVVAALCGLELGERSDGITAGQIRRNLINAVKLVSPGPVLEVRRAYLAEV